MSGRLTIVTPETLIAQADEIDRRVGPISGRTADRLAVMLREAAAQIAGIVHPTGSETFAGALSGLNAPAPWVVCEDACGSVLDANGQIVCSADYRVTDKESALMAMWIVIAVNTCAGFKEEMDPAKIPPQ